MLSTKSPVLMFQTIVSSLAGYISLFFILRFIGPLYWGYLSYALAFGGMLSLILDLGFNTTYLKFVSQDTDKKADLSTIVFIKVVLNLIYVVAIVGSLLIWVYVLKKGFENSIEFWAILTIIPYFSFQSLIPVLTSYFRSTFQSFKLAVPRLIESLFRNLIFVVLGILFMLHMEGRIGINVVIVLAFFYDVSYFMYLVILFMFGKPWHFKKSGKRDYAKYIKFALPLSLSTSLGIINLSVDKIIVQFFWGAVATGALYADQRMVSIIGSLSGPVGMFLIPLLSTHNAKDSKEYDRDVIEYERILSLLAMPFVLAFFLLSPFILNLLNATYISYWPSFSIIAVGAYLTVLIQPFSSSIASMGKQWVMARISLISIVLNIAMNLVLIPNEIFGFKLFGLGVEGATISFTVCQLISYAMNKELHRKLNKNRTKSTFSIHLLIALPTGILFLFSAFYVRPYPFMLLFPIVLAGFALYALMSILTKEITMYQVKTIIKNLIPNSRSGLQ